MAVTVKSSGPRGAKTYEIRWKNGELYNYTDNAYAARKIAAQARKEEKAYYAPSRRNPSSARRVGAALKKYVKLTNFSGIVKKNSNGTVSIVGRAKRR